MFLRSIAARSFTLTLFIRSSERMNKVSVKLRAAMRSEEHTSELQSRSDLVCRLLLEKKKEVRWDEGRDGGPAAERKPDMVAVLVDVVVWRQHAGPTQCRDVSRYHLGRSLRTRACSAH